MRGYPLGHPDSSEFVCRKETEKKLKQFLRSTDDRIFKGRLQLFKKESSIGVAVKGEVIGMINEKDFLNLINNVSN